MTDGIILYAIGCLTGLLVGLMLLTAQAHMVRLGTHEKTAAVMPSSEMADDAEDDRLSRQFDNYLSYTGKNQDED